MKEHPYFKEECDIKPVLDTLCNTVTVSDIIVSHHALSESDTPSSSFSLSDCSRSPSTAEAIGTRFFA